jgi:hypothetical protein
MGQWPQDQAVPYFYQALKSRRRRRSVGGQHGSRARRLFLGIFDFLLVLYVHYQGWRLILSLDIHYGMLCIGNIHHNRRLTDQPD